MSLRHGIRPASALTLLLLLSLPLAAQPYVVGTSTLLGGTGADSVRDLVIAEDGSVYVTGGTDSADFYATPGAYDASPNGSMDAYVAKFDPQGGLVWATFIGGPGYDRAYAIELDPQGNVVVGGRSGPGFPTTSGALAMQFMSVNEVPHPKYGQQDGFVAKLSGDGSTLLWATRFGNTEQDFVRDLDVTPTGEILVVGTNVAGATWAPQVDAAMVNAFQGGTQDLALARLSGDGTQCLWARRIGGSGHEWTEGSVRAAADGDAIVLCVTDSQGIATPGAFQTAKVGGTSSWDFYVARVDHLAGGLVWGTYLGGSGDEHIETHELALDSQGNPIIASGTTSSDFPMTPGAYQPSYGGSGGTGTGYNTNYPGDIVVAKLSADGSQLLASTYLGGQFGEATEGVAIDASDNLYLTGATYSPDFPRTADAPQFYASSGADAFAIKLSPDFGTLLFSSYIGGSENEGCRSADVTPDGVLWIGGMSKSADYPTANALQSQFGGGPFDGVISHFLPESVASTVTAPFFGTLAPFTVASGTLWAGPHEAMVADNARLLLPGRVYGDVRVVLEVDMSGLAAGSNVGVLVHAATPQDTHTSPGDQTQVYLRAAGGGSCRVYLRARNPATGQVEVLAAGPLLPVDPLAGPVSFEVRTLGDAVTARVADLPALAEPLPHGARTGLLSLTTSAPSYPVAMRLNFALVRSGTHLPDVTIDDAGHVWLSFVQDGFYSTFNPLLWDFRVNGVVWDAFGFLNDWLPFFDRVEGVGANHCLFGCTVAELPVGTIIATRYADQTEADMAR